MRPYLLVLVGLARLTPLSAQAAAPAPDTGKAAPAGAAAAPAAPAPVITLSGYVTASYFYASKPTDSMIVGRLYDRFHNRVIMNAARISLDKAVATDKFDAGVHVDALFGENAPPLQSVGFKIGDQGDLPQAYVTLNVPTGKATYVQFKGGKMWTLLDVEVVDEVSNPNFSHGYEYIYLTNFTNTGLGIDAKFSPKVDAEFRLINGWDVVVDNNTGKSLMGRLGITPSDPVALAFFGYYGPEQAGNTSNQRYGGEFVGTFKPHANTTVYLQYDIGAEQGIAPGGGDAHWWGAGVWGVFDLSGSLQLALRGDYMSDEDGVRTSGVLGFPVAPNRKLQSGTVTFNIKAWPHALVRPEIRYEHSSRDDFGNTGSAGPNQLTGGLALSYQF
ncbi:MAG TPA: outer membrane beta-barrel protein [Gemmatimonadales bacterium]|nr:outer membrane beta-barrel protein [Gemmatimonadales bacterium]